MRYRFAGGNDVPDWLLAEVSVLSAVSCVRLKLITRLIINDLCGAPLDFDRLKKFLPKEGACVRRRGPRSRRGSVLASTTTAPAAAAAAATTHTQ